MKEIYNLILINKINLKSKDLMKKTLLNTNCRIFESYSS